MNSNPVSQAPGRLDYLDGLRGMAALFVVFYHFCNAFVVGVAPANGLGFLLFQTPLRIFVNGNFSVFTFFVLSGFVLSESVVKAQKGLLIRVIARYFRLTIPMVVSLILAWVLIKAFSPGDVMQMGASSNDWLRTAFPHESNFPSFGQALKDGFYRVYLHGYSNLNNVVWTMRKELIGSIAIYFIYRYSPSRYRWTTLWTFLVITLWGPIYLGFPAGALLRELWAAGRLRDSRWSWLALAIAAFIACDGRLHFSHHMANDSVVSQFIDRIHPYAYSFAAALLVFAVLTLPPLRSGLRRTVPRFIGRISFALYLVHVPIIGSLMVWLDPHVGGPFYFKLATLFVVFLAAALSGGWLMTVTVDEPLTIRLRHLKKIVFLQRASSMPRQLFQHLAARKR